MQREEQEQWMRTQTGIEDLRVIGDTPYDNALAEVYVHDVLVAFLQENVVPEETDIPKYLYANEPLLAERLAMSAHFQEPLDTCEIAIRKDTHLALRMATLLLPDQDLSDDPRLTQRLLDALLRKRQDIARLLFQDLDPITVRRWYDAVHER